MQVKRSFLANAPEDIKLIVQVVRIEIICEEVESGFRGRGSRVDTVKKRGVESGGGNSKIQPINESTIGKGFESGCREETVERREGNVVR